MWQEEAPTKHDSEKRKTFSLILKFHHCPDLYHWKYTLGLCKWQFIRTDSKENYSTRVFRHSQWGTDFSGNTKNVHRTLRNTRYLGVTLGSHNFICSKKCLCSFLQMQLSGICHHGPQADESHHCWHTKQSQKYPVGAPPPGPEPPIRNVDVV